MCCYLNDPQMFFLFSDSCSWVSCLSWTVKLSAVLPKNPSAPTHTLVFQHFCILEPFPTMTVWFWDPSFHTRTTEGLVCNYYRRLKHSLMLQKEKPCIKSRGVKTFEQNEGVYFSFNTALQKLQKIVTCFPEDKLSSIYPDLQIQKVECMFFPSEASVYFFLFPSLVF